MPPTYALRPVIEPMMTTCPDRRGDHPRQHRTRDVEQGVEVDVDHLRPLFARQLHERLEHADAGVVDQHLRVDARERRRDGLRVGDVDDSWPADPPRASISWASDSSSSSDRATPTMS